MKNKLTNCFRCSSAGLTLIEVLASIAILATILVGIVMARASHTRQVTLSERRSRAVAAADELLSVWWSSGQAIPVDCSGTIDGDDSLLWRSNIVANSDVKAMGARVLRVEIFQSSLENFDISEDMDNVLVAVELIIPQETLSAETKRGGDFE